MTNNDINTICEKLDSLHKKILKSNFAERVSESEMMALILAVGTLNRQKADLKQKDTEIDILIRKKETLKDEIENLKEELFIAKQKRANIFELIEKYEQGRIAGMKEFEKKSEEILIEKYEKYHLIGNARLKEGVDMFYQGKAEAIWECIGVNRNLVKEMTEQM